jgi:hypothetical protein
MFGFAVSSSNLLHCSIYMFKQCIQYETQKGLTYLRMFFSSILQINIGCPS